MEEQLTSGGAALAGKMSGVMRKIGYFQKKSQMDLGGGRGFKYAPLDTIIERVNETLAEAGICVSRSSSRLESLQVVQRDGKAPQIHCVVTVAIWVTDGTTEYGPYEGTGSAADTGDKYAMKASSAAMKYALQKMGLIAWGDDPEATPPESEPAKEGEPEKPKKAPGGRAKPQAPNADTFAARLEVCKDLDTLKALRSELVSLKRTLDLGAYDVLKGEFLAKEAVLKGTEEKKE